MYICIQYGPRPRFAFVVVHDSPARIIRPHLDLQRRTCRMQNGPLFSMKMDDFKITHAGSVRVEARCCAPNAGFSEVSRAASGPHLYFSYAQHFPARTCAGEKCDFSKSLRKSESECGQQTSFCSRNSPLDLVRIRHASACVGGVRRPAPSASGGPAPSASGEPRRAQLLPASDNSLSGNRLWQQVVSWRATRDTIQRILSHRANKTCGNFRAVRRHGVTQLGNCAQKKGAPTKMGTIQTAISLGKTRAICAAAR